MGRGDGGARDAHTLIKEYVYDIALNGERGPDGMMEEQDTRANRKATSVVAVSPWVMRLYFILFLLLLASAF